ncbi:MAG: YitT family protein [Oliverpabstia sp.]
MKCNLKGRIAMKHIIGTSVSILIGNCLLAFMMAAFVIPNEMIMGGVTGISLVLPRIYTFKNFHNCVSAQSYHACSRWNFSWKKIFLYYNCKFIAISSNTWTYAADSGNRKCY